MKSRVFARIFIAVTAVCLALTAVPFLAPGSMPVASAANVQLTGSNKADINSALAGYAQGTVVDLTLHNDINVDDSSIGDQLTTGTIDGIVIPKGITVNLYMNGKRIYFSRNGKGESGFWKLTGLRAVVNKGTLNVYSGTVSSPNRASASDDTSSIYVFNNRTGMDSSNNKETAFVRLEAISNEGTLTVNKNVTVFVKSELAYKDKSGSYPNDATATTAVAAIFNVSNSASVAVRSAVITAYADARSISDKGDTAESRAYAYGIYGGKVKVESNSIFTTTALLRNAESNLISNKEGKVTGIAIGICTNGGIDVDGGTFNFASDVSADNNALEKGTAYIYQCGIFYGTGATPTLCDGTINVASKNTFSYNKVKNKNYSEGTILTSARLPWSPSDVFSSVTNNLYNRAVEDSNYPARISTNVTAGQYKDEAGNIYNTDISTSPDSHPTSIDRGALKGSYRVHIIYRYWVDSQRSALYEAITTTDGTAGYSFAPLNDESDVVKTKAQFTGLASATNYTKDPESGIKYSSGGEPYNSNFWQLKSINYEIPTTGAWFSDKDFSKICQTMKSFETDTNITVGNGAQSPVYIYVDYVKKIPATISMSLTSNTAVYTGKPILASVLGASIRNEKDQTDCTADYDLDKTGAELIPVNYEWTGTTAAGAEVSGSGSLPVSVGSYSVTAVFDDNTVYNKNDKLYKNREAYSYTFSLDITPSEVSRGTLPVSVSLTYGEKLSEALKLSGFAADGVNGEKPAGTFSFKNSVDGSGYKNAGKGSVDIIWTPTDSKGNYKQTVFTVSYTVAKAQLNIRPVAATVVYGESSFKKAFSSYFEGLVANDNNDDVKAQIEAVLSYTVLRNGSWYPYKAGETPAGTYPIRATLTDSTLSVLSNYEYSYVFGATDNPEGILTVEKRPITVVATAIGRPYDPDNGTVAVKFDITEGKLLADDLSVVNTTGSLGSRNAGIQLVNDINTSTVPALLSGGKRDNYVLEKLLYSTGDYLTVEITKAVPSVSVPSLGAVFYRRTQTLADIDLSGYNVGGTWQWTDRTVNPTVAVGAYSARFTPDDQSNYEAIVTDIPLTVNPTPVVISYKGEVSYGDNVPNITAYTYSAPNDPSFSIDAVTTTGNINVSTDYKVGSTVSASGYAVYIYAPNFKDVNGNYSFTTQNGVITVKPRKIVFTVSDATVTYGENFVTDSVTVTFDESRLVGDDKATDITSNGVEPSFTVSTAFDYFSNYNVGVYDLVANRSFTTSPNYDVEILNGKLTVKKADLVIKAKNISVTYGSDVPDLSQQYELIGAKKGDTLVKAVTSGSVTFGTTYKKGASVNAEGYNFYIDISGAAFQNYNVSVESGIITVVKADPVITKYPTATITYGETLAEAVFTGGTSNIEGTYVYDRADIRPAWQEAPWTIYTATFVPDDTVNYNTVAGLNISLTVNKRAITGSLAVKGNPMLNEELTVDVSGLDPDSVGTYTFVWTVGGVNVGTGTTLLLNKQEYVGKPVTVTATATGYYTGTASFTTTQIAPTLTSVTTILTDSEFDKYFNIGGLDFNGSKTVVYNGMSQNVTVSLRSDVTAIARVGEITVKYNGSTSAPAAAGTYNVTIDIATPAFGTITTGPDGKTYDGSTVVYSPVSNFRIGTLVISQAPYDVTVSVNDKVYDGYTSATATVTDESGAVTLTGGIKDDVKFAKASFVFADANVGTGKTVAFTDASLTGASAANYRLVLTIQNGGKANITPRKLLVKANPISREYEYGNYSVDVSFEINTASIAPTDSSASIGVNEAAVSGSVDDFRAGTRKVTLSNVELTGAKKDNYVLEITNLTNLTVQILKATPSYPIPYVADLTYDAGRHLSVVSLGDSRWSWDQSVRNEIPAAGFHTYTAVYTPSDTSNYATVSYEVSFTVNKALVEVKAASFTVTYGDTEPTYYTTVKGLTGSDTVKTLDGFVLLNCAYQSDSTVGTYQITIDGQYESDNYTFIYVPGSVTVKQRTVYVTAEAVNREYEPGNVKVTVRFSALSNVRAGDEGNVYLENASVDGTVANDTAGKKTVDYILPELAGSAAQNYELKLLNTNLTVEILKAHLAGVVLPSSASMFYGDKLSTAKWTSAYEGADLGTFSMKDPMSTPKAVGTTSNVYKVVFTPFNSINYATVEQYITLTVERATLNLEMSITGVLSSGSKLYVVTNSIPADAPQYIVYNWYRVNNPDEDYKSGKLISYNTSEYTLTDADEGAYIVVVAQNTADSPYIISAKCISDASVEQPKMSFWQRIMKWFYRLIAAISAVFGRIR